MKPNITSTVRPGYAARGMKLVVRKIPATRDAWELRLSDGTLTVLLELDGQAPGEMFHPRGWQRGAKVLGFRTKRAAIHYAVSNGLDFVTVYHIKERQ